MTSWSFHCNTSPRRSSGHYQCVLAFLLSLVVHLVQGQDTGARARLVEPPMRSSYWREGVADASVNDYDEQLNCGGFEYMWGPGKGQCGACGDRVFGIKENEYPGKYSNAPAQRAYRSGKEINVTVYTSGNLLGYFFFRICPFRDGPNLLDLDTCFTSRSPLVINETGSTRYYPGSLKGFHDLHLIIPANLSCQHCILQWNYITGYREHKVNSQCESCLGCEPQERFVNCADIEILGEGVYQTDPEAGVATSKSTATSNSILPTTSSKPAVTTSTTVPSSSTQATTLPSTRPSHVTADIRQPCTPLAEHVTCEARGIQKLIPGMGTWCLRTCQAGSCRSEFCTCFCKYPTFKIHIDPSAFEWVATSKQFHPNSLANGKSLCYKTTPLWSKTPGLNGWCSSYCPSESCEDMCSVQVCP